MHRHMHRDERPDERQDEHHGQCQEWHGAEHCDEYRNEVILAGRLPETPVERVLPSGDRMTTWRVIVRRPAGDGPDDRPKARVDSIPCVSFDPKLCGLVTSWDRADFVTVTGMIRRRFWRTPEGGASSRIEVEVHTARRLERVPATSG
ncbi:MAG TPA: single-stranded DNA-binding protein [Thermopolyspora sp.]